jgi:hypothetical protein
MEKEVGLLEVTQHNVQQLVHVQVQVHDHHGNGELQTRATYGVVCLVLSTPSLTCHTDAENQEDPMRG